MKKFNHFFKKEAIFALILTVCMNMSALPESMAISGERNGFKGPIKVAYASENDSDSKDKEEAQKETDETEVKEETVNEDELKGAQLEEELKPEEEPEEEEATEEEGGDEIKGSAENGRPELTLSYEKSSTEPIDKQIIDASYKEYSGHKVTHIAWNLSGTPNDWVSISDAGVMSIEVTRNCIVSAAIKTDTGIIVYKTIGVNNIDEYAPKFKLYDNGRPCLIENVGEVVNGKSKAVRISVYAEDEELGMPEKPYACTDNREAYLAVTGERKNVTAEQLAMVEWQENPEFEVHKNGRYYVIARDVLNNIDYELADISCIDIDVPETEVTQEYTEVEGYVSENKLIAASHDVGGAGLVELGFGRMD